MCFCKRVCICDEWTQRGPFCAFMHYQELFKRYRSQLAVGEHRGGGMLMCSECEILGTQSWSRGSPFVRIITPSGTTVGLSDMFACLFWYDSNPFPPWSMEKLLNDALEKPKLEVLKRKLAQSGDPEMNNLDVQTCQWNQVMKVTSITCDPPLFSEVNLEPFWMVIVKVISNTWLGAVRKPVDFRRVRRDVVWWQACSSAHRLKNSLLAAICEREKIVVRNTFQMKHLHYKCKSLD